MIKLKIVFGILICICVIAGCGAPEPQPIFPPVSKSAHLISTSGTEDAIEATGIGVGKKSELTSNAILDAKRSALYFVLYGAGQPILQTQAEKNEFENPAISNKYFGQNLSKYISEEASKVKERLSIDGGKRLKITKDFRINKALLKADLAADGIVKSETGMQDDVGTPSLMVIPKVPSEVSPIDAMYSDTQLEFAAQVVKSHLANRRYEFYIPEQSLVIADQEDAQLMLKDMEPDLSKQLALVIGSDVYITYSIDVRSRAVGGQNVKKAIVSVEAFDTATAQSLGTETGYSAERAATDKEVIEEGITQAFDKVLSMINAYWKLDVKKGIQYKITFRISSDFDRDERQKLRFALIVFLEDMSKKADEKIATDMTLEYLIRVDPEKYSQSVKIVGAIVTKFTGGKVSDIFSKGKLIMLEIEPN